MKYNQTCLSSLGQLYEQENVNLVHLNLLFLWGHFRPHSYCTALFHVLWPSPNSYYISVYLLFETLCYDVRLMVIVCQNATHRTWHNKTRSKTTPSIRIKLHPTTKHLWHQKNGTEKKLFFIILIPWEFRKKML